MAHVWLTTRHSRIVSVVDVSSEVAGRYVLFVIQGEGMYKICQR